MSWHHHCALVILRNSCKSNNTKIIGFLPKIIFNGQTQWFDTEPQIQVVVFFLPLISFSDFCWLASPKLLVKGEGDRSHSNLHNDASALSVTRVNMSLPAPRAACQSQ